MACSRRSNTKTTARRSATTAIRLIRNTRPIGREAKAAFKPALEPLRASFGSRPAQRASGRGLWPSCQASRSVPGVGRGSPTPSSCYGKGRDHSRPVAPFCPFTSSCASSPLLFPYGQKASLRRASCVVPPSLKMIFDRVAVRMTYLGVVKRRGTPHAPWFIMIELNRIPMNQSTAKMASSPIWEGSSKKSRCLGSAFKFTISDLFKIGRQVERRHVREKSKARVFGEFLFDLRLTFPAYETLHNQGIIFT
jgi:hypothetical protein